MTYHTFSSYPKSLFLSLLLALLCSVHAHGQKNSYVGMYQNNNVGGDTLSGYFFLSIDSFKVLYTISIKDGDDLRLPLIMGKWDLYKEGDDDIGVFMFPDTVIKVPFHKTSLTGDMAGEASYFQVNNVSYSHIVGHTALRQ